MDGVAQDGQIIVGDVALSLPKPARFLNGSAVQLVCRPEGIRLGASKADVNSVDGRVTFVRDLGPVRDIYLDTALGKLVAEQGADRSQGLALGQTVRLSLPPEALRIYSDQSSVRLATALAAE